MKSGNTFILWLTSLQNPPWKGQKCRSTWDLLWSFCSVWRSVWWVWPLMAMTCMTNRCFFQFFSQLELMGMQGRLCSLGFPWEKNAEIRWRFFFRKKQFLFSVHTNFNQRLNWVVLTTRDDVLPTWKDILSHLDRIKVVRASTIAVKTLPLLLSLWDSAGSFRENVLRIEPGISL